MLVILYENMKTQLGNCANGTSFAVNSWWLIQKKIPTRKTNHQNQLATTNPQSEQLNIIARTNSRKTKTERERRNLEEAKKKVPEVGLEKEEGERVKKEKSVRRLGGELLGCWECFGMGFIIWVFFWGAVLFFAIDVKKVKKQRNPRGGWQQLKIVDWRRWNYGCITLR